MRTVVSLMKALVGAIVLAASLLSLQAQGADDAKVRDGTAQIETGTKKIGSGQIGEGIEETAKGVGKTVVEGAKFAGEKLKESSQAAEPHAKSAWEKVRDGTIDFGRGVKVFFSRLLEN